MDLNTTTSIITLNISRLNSPIKREFAILTKQAGFSSIAYQRRDTLYI